MGVGYVTIPEGACVVGYVTMPEGGSGIANLDKIQRLRRWDIAEV